MGKRFTETEKWKDKWFRSLRAEFKLAYLYLLDNCDHAGVIDLDEPLAEFQIGNAIDWKEFFAACEGRIARLESGKLFICKFIEYQYGELSEECRGHNPVFLSLKRHNLLKGYLKGIQRGQDTDKDKDKDKDKNKEKDKEEHEEDVFAWIIPEQLDTPEIRELLTRFAEMRKRIKKPIKDFANTSLILKRFDSVEHLAYALETCVANDYQGLKPDYRPPSGFIPGGSRAITPDGFHLTEAQRRLANNKKVMEDFANG